MRVLRAEKQCVFFVEDGCDIVIHCSTRQKQGPFVRRVEVGVDVDCEAPGPCLVRLEGAYFEIDLTTELIRQREERSLPLGFARR